MLVKNGRSNKRISLNGLLWRHYLFHSYLVQAWASSLLPAPWILCFNLLHPPLFSSSIMPWQMPSGYFQYSFPFSSLKSPNLSYLIFLYTLYHQPPIFFSICLQIHISIDSILSLFLSPIAQVYDPQSNPIYKKIVTILFSSPIFLQYKILLFLLNSSYATAVLLLT